MIATREKTLYMSLQIQTSEIPTLNIHIKITAPTTRLWVTSSLYLRWRWTARNLSILRAMTLRSEAAHRAHTMTSMVDFKAWSAVFCLDEMTISIMYNGWANKPAIRSETARLRRSVLKGAGKDEVFLKAWIVKELNTMAEKDVKAFKTRLTMCETSMLCSKRKIL